ncbi:MAG: 3-isopropylmalate dehydratase small subunit [Planctomycetales bacterium]
MPAIQTVAGSGVPLLLDDIDTDRIIPARFLRCVTFEGLGAHAFEDDRAQDAAHPFDDPRYRQGKILVAGRNFGCGSSREHAPQALMRWGIAAVVAESFAEIFFGNCTSLGIPAVTAKRADLERLAAAVENDPELEITIDLEAKEIRFGGKTVPCDIPESARTALVTGQYDVLGTLRAAEPRIREAAERLPYLRQFA